MALVRWKLAAYLKAHNLTAYKVAQKIGGMTRVPTVYRMADPNKIPGRVDLGTLAEVLVALRQLTGEAVDIGDLLEFDVDGTPPTPGGGSEEA